MKVLLIRTDRDGAKFWDELEYAYGNLESTGSPMLDAIRANLNTIGVAQLEIIPEVTDNDPAADWEIQPPAAGYAGGMHEHDGLQPHSHEVRPDHLGVACKP